MRKLIKKILKENYEKNLLSNICNRISTGSNKQSPYFIKTLVADIMKTDLSDDVKNKVQEVFKKWKSDMYYSVDNGRYHKDSLYGSTGDSESDIGNTYLSEIQSIVCEIYMDMD
jgi:hypothetical protein